MKAHGLVLMVAALAAGCGGPPSTAATPAIEQEVQLTTADTPDQITPRIVAAFLDHELPVTSSQGGIIEAKLPRENGMMGQYDLSAHAIVLPSGTGSQIRLYAEQTRVNQGLFSGTQRATSASSGRAGRTWTALVAIAKAIQPDSTRRRLISEP